MYEDMMKFHHHSITLIIPDPFLCVFAFVVVVPVYAEAASRAPSSALAITPAPFLQPG
jgi:hypothetical protein